jgi:AcrR family transcriptional regulator
MARTKSDNFEDIRATILDVAASLFAKRGFRNTNIIDIGEACNASKSRMYHYFPSKEAMLAEMLREHVSSLVVIASDLVSAPLDPRTRLRRYFFAHLKYYYEQRDRHTVLIEDVNHLPEDVRVEVDADEQKLVGFLCALLREINAQKFKDRQTATTHAMLMYGMLNWTYTWYQPTGRLSLQTLADQATELCLHGIV